MDIAPDGDVVAHLGSSNLKQKSPASKLSKYLTVDLISASCASFLVSPLITIVDRSIMQNASGVMKITDSLKYGVRDLFFSPQFFFRRPEFWMIFGVYTATYSTANAVNTSCEFKKVESAFPRFFSTSLVNMVTCVSKDRAFTRMFGASLPTSLPISTYMLFMVRDCATIAASFNMPGYLSFYLQGNGMDVAQADFSAQMICPAAVQFASTPLHLLGLDLYNNPMSTIKNRVSFMKDKYLVSVAARIGRIGPAFGIGGVSNTAIRKNLRKTFLE